MTAVKKTMTSLAMLMVTVDAYASSPVQDVNSDIGCVLLLSAGLLGLFAARKHMKAAD